MSRCTVRGPLVTSLLLACGCGSEQHLTNPPPPGVEDHVVVSEPVPFGQASSVGSIALGGTGVTAATTFSFTTFRPGAFPEGDAVEILNRRTLEREATESGSNQADAERPSKRGSSLGDLLWGTKRRQGLVETIAKQTARTVGSQIGRQIFRGLLGGILGGSRRR